MHIKNVLIFWIFIYAWEKTVTKLLSELPSSFTQIGFNKHSLILINDEKKLTRLAPG